MAATFHQLGMVAQFGGRLGEAEQWYQQSLAIKEELGDRPGLALTYGQLGLLAERKGDAVGALQWTVRCVSLFEEFPHPLTEPGPDHLARLARRLGVGVLREQWRRVTGRNLPAVVEKYVEESLDAHG